MGQHAHTFTVSRPKRAFPGKVSSLRPAGRPRTEVPDSEYSSDPVGDETLAALLDNDNDERNEDDNHYNMHEDDGEHGNGDEDVPCALPVLLRND